MFFNDRAVVQIMEALDAVRSFFLQIWWLWLFPFLLLAAGSLWLAYVREWYRLHIPWTMFELKIPREILRSPRAMEQVLTSIYALRNAPGNIVEKWWDGEVTEWFSLELASFGGEIRFFMRTPTQHRSMVEAALYSHYPDLELVELAPADDYIHRFPRTVDEVLKNHRLFGSESILARPDVYPIRTYMDFEEAEEDFRLDPIGTLLEVIGKCGSQEELWMQILIRPAGDGWKEEGEKEIEVLKEKSTIRTVSPEFGTFEMTRLFPGFGIAELIKAIDKNIAKPGFDTVIRYLYITAPGAYNSNFARRGVSSALNQHASKALNEFSYNRSAATHINKYKAPYFWFFYKQRFLARQKRIYRNYRRRHIYPETLTENALAFHGFHFGIGAWRSSRMVLNTEELATLYHLPTKPVMSSQLIRKVEAHKMGPPMGLAIYGEEGESDLPGMKK